MPILLCCSKKMLWLRKSPHMSNHIYQPNFMNCNLCMYLILLLWYQISVKELINYLLITLNKWLLTVKPPNKIKTPPPPHPTAPHSRWWPRSCWRCQPCSPSSLSSWPQQSWDPCQLACQTPRAFLGRYRCVIEFYDTVLWGGIFFENNFLTLK